IWLRKEIENYLIVLSALTRFINRRAPARTQHVTENEISVQLDLICVKLREEVFDAMSAEILAENRALGGGGANKEARKLLESRWNSLEDRLAAVSGKEVFARLSEWSQSQFGVAVAASQIARELMASEI